METNDPVVLNTNKQGKQGYVTLKVLVLAYTIFAEHVSLQEAWMYLF